MKHRASRVSKLASVSSQRYADISRHHWCRCVLINPGQLAVMSIIKFALHCKFRNQFSLMMGGNHCLIPHTVICSTRDSQESCVALYCFWSIQQSVHWASEPLISNCIIELGKGGDCSGVPIPLVPHSALMSPVQQMPMPEPVIRMFSYNIVPRKSTVNSSSTVLTRRVSTRVDEPWCQFDVTQRECEVASEE